jgi:N-carbamoyl-L-amino-acid hydrolase
MDHLPLDLTHLLHDLETLASFTEAGFAGWTRRAFSPAFVEGRGWLAAQMRAAGLTTAIDAAGNLVGRREGTTSAPTLVIGSHTDTVPGAGRFDGMLGVLTGIAVARALQSAGVGLRHPLEIIDFLAEEPNPFGVSCIGSMGLAGALDRAALDRRDHDGRTLAEALSTVGGQPDALATVTRAPGAVAAYLELHIEQGRVLETANVALGAVRGIVGIRRARLRLTGRPDHAGTTPMTLRYDALAAAAETVLAVERAGRATPDAVATVGALTVSPNQENVVPGAVELAFELRSLDWPTIERLWQGVMDTTQAACAARGVALTIDDVANAAPMWTPDWLVRTIADICAELVPGAPTLASGAGHDATWMGRIAPSGMIFVRCRDGRSHCPEEYAAPDDIAAGLAALAQTLLVLDRQLD